MKNDDQVKKAHVWENMSTVWAGVGEKRRRGLRILPKNTGYFVHVTSRTVGQAFMFGDEEKRVFVRMMRQWAGFSGLSVITYCLMDNHFHVMLWVPGAVDLDHAELRTTLEGIWPEEKVLAWDAFYQKQRSEVKEEMDAVVVARMGNLPEFMRVLKQSFTCWYNRKHGRKGTLWEARYRSVVVEGNPLALMSVAAYIDLNPLRAGLVDDPMAYAWSGYGASMEGDSTAREGLEVLVRLARGHQPQVALNLRRKQVSQSSEHWRDIGKTMAQEQMQRALPRNWQEVQAAYRIWLVNKGASKADVLQVKEKFRQRKGFDPVQVIAEYEKQGVVPLHERLEGRMQTFSRGVAVGSADYLESMMNEFRSCFGCKRKSAAKKVKGFSSLWMSLREVD
ncbi:hypothetical protein P3T73_09400 [Kiritimatiellota bacterium B12222]|nr:hypothetical protein P3T73_09400 [Kiritimatiellota bacterium B12222]